MLKSMTGYAKIQEISELCKVSCEVKTLNSKSLNVEVNLPNYLFSKELEIISLVKEFINRGKVQIKLSIKFLRPLSINIDLNLIESYYKVLSEIHDNFDIPAPIDMSNLLFFRDAFQMELSNEDIESLWTVVKPVIEKTLEKVVDERIKEGERLEKDIHKMTEEIKKVVEHIERESTELPKVYAEKLRKKKVYAEKLRKNIRELLPEGVELDTNLLENAVALVADKADIREEIVRIKSHLAKVEECMKSSEPCGDMLNFLAQEFNREFNTILSKSKLNSITDLALKGKFISSQFKEQIQNIE